MQLIRVKLVGGYDSVRHGKEKEANGANLYYH